MCDHCDWWLRRVDAEALLERMRAFHIVQPGLGTDGIATLDETSRIVGAIHTEITRAHHVSRKQREALFLAEETLDALQAGRNPRDVETLLRERYEQKENPMPKKPKLAPAGTSLKRQTEGRACKGCIHEDIPIEEQPCCECTEESPKYDVGPQETTPKDDHETDEAKVALGEGVKALKDFVAGDIERMRRMGADPETGEVPSTDRDVAVPAIAGLVQRIVEENAPRALAAYLETKQPASFSVTCKISSDPVRSASVFIEVSGKLAVGVKGASGFVSIDDQQTRLPGT